MSFLCSVSLLNQGWFCKGKERPTQSYSYKWSRCWMWQLSVFAWHDKHRTRFLFCFSPKSLETHGRRTFARLDLSGFFIFFQTRNTKTNIALNQRQISVLVLQLIFFFFTVLAVVLVSVCSLIKGITPKIRMLCYVLINGVLLNLFFFLPQWAELIVSLSPGHTLIGLRWTSWWPWSPERWPVCSRRFPEITGEDNLIKVSLCYVTSDQNTVMLCYFLLLLFYIPSN